MSGNVQHSAPVRGIALMVISALFMNLNNAILKLLTEGLPPGEIMFLRAAMILPLVVVVALSFFFKEDSPSVADTNGTFCSSVQHLY